MSLSQQLRRLQGRIIHLNIIRVGVENFTNADEQEIDLAVDTTRRIYAQAGVAIGRVEHFAIRLARARGHEVINGDNEAIALINEFSVGNDGVDIFWVRMYVSDVAGIAPTPGPCGGDDKDGGIVIERPNGGPNSLVTLAHELGHYLGNDHRPDRNALMFESAAGGTALNDEESTRMRGHCVTRAGC